MDLLPLPPPSPPSPAQPPVSHIEAPLPPHPPAHDDPSSPPWDWSEFLDFGLDDQLNISISPDRVAAEPDLEDPDTRNEPARVRKRDPRLICSNFLAGRIPCACPELDEKLEEEEGVPGKKARTARSAAGTARCQVPGCEADISELKGYHRRHRVCLGCANASAVVLDGQRKRYCQQCGKFHILSDFDEGKRSCRRKLERHNNRRRRKPMEPRVLADNEAQVPGLADDVAHDDENGKDNICTSNQFAEREHLLEPEEGQISSLFSYPDSQNIQSDGDVSFMASGEAQIDGEKDESKYARSSFSCNKRSYTSMCPTGRISFKLYDWNPAEFPRRLRHQIFQWLASMPVELEGYIRPGCTILTVFIAMPNSMWFKLFQDPVAYIHDFVGAPGRMLFGRGTLLVYLDNGIFHVSKGGNSVMQVKLKGQAPKLHYVHPTCFEAGKPMEFVACGSNLIQPKFRFLVSFAGKYLAYDYSVPPVCSDPKRITANFSHQLLKINIPPTEPDLAGPAFIEVENESGLSNFIPVLIGSREICSEMKIMEHKFEASLYLKGSKSMSCSSLTNSCEVSTLRQTEISQVLLDAAWLIRKPASADVIHSLSLSQIRRFNRLIPFLIQNKSIVILERVLLYVGTLIDHIKPDHQANDVGENDMSLLRRHLDYAREILCQRFQEKQDPQQYSSNAVAKGNDSYQSSCLDMLSLVSLTDKDRERARKGNLDAEAGSNSEDQSGIITLLEEEVSRSIEVMKERRRKSCSRIYTNGFLTSRPLIFVIAVAAVCCGICVVILHPQKVGKIATSIRRCLFERT